MTMTEKGSYTGFLSTNTEVHAFAIGLYDGMKNFRMRPTEMRDNEDVQAEPHYYAGAYVIGTVLQLIVLIAIIINFVPW